MTPENRKIIQNAYRNAVNAYNNVVTICGKPKEMRRANNLLAINKGRFIITCKEQFAYYQPQLDTVQLCLETLKNMGNTTAVIQARAALTTLETVMKIAHDDKVVAVPMEQLKL